MKNIRIFLSQLLALSALASCNLDQFPDDAIDTTHAMESVSDCENFRTGLYAGMKYCFTGIYVYAPELQTDLYHAVLNFGNFQGAFYSYSVLANEGACNNAWFGLYNYIANANFLIEGTRKLLDRGTLSEADAALVRRYYGEACYIRAHMYYLLVQFFCEDYEPATAGDVYGVPVVTVYAPTPDASKYPSRGSLAKTYAQIVADLTEAETYVTAPGQPNSIFVTADVVPALQARVALSMHDYSTAFNKAKGLIDSGRYPLESDRTAYAEAWLRDNLCETLWQPVMTGPDDTGNSFPYFINNATGREGEDNPQYVPEDWALKLYDKTNDIRYDAYFSERELRMPVTGRLTLLVKYPGNPQLYTQTTNYVNQPKVFRISEMYLIAAEAAANRQGQESIASYYLNELKSKRIAGWYERDYSGQALVKEIRDERVRELFGEGQRLFDLKRWHIGFQRSAGQNPALMQPGANYVSCMRPADDPFFLWPIPTDEVQANPQIEQNPAYTIK